MAIYQIIHYLRILTSHVISIHVCECAGECMCVAMVSVLALNISQINKIYIGAEWKVRKRR